MNKYTPREAVCDYMGWSFDEAPDYRYQYGRTTKPVYSTSKGAVCATNEGEQPPNKKDFPWKRATGSQADYCASRGKIIWIAEE